MNSTENMRGSGSIRNRVWILCLILVVIAPMAHALIMVGEGNSPVQDAGWPEGALAVANLKTRSGWWEGPPFGGGESHFDYHGSTAEFNQALELFAHIIAPRLELVIHAEPNFGFRGAKVEQAPPIDWSFTVWNPERWHLLFNNPKTFFVSELPNFRQLVDPPRIDVYPGAGVEWDKARVPTQITVIDRRISSIGMAPGRGAVIRADISDMATRKPIPGARLSVTPANPKEENGKTSGGAADARGHVQLEQVTGDNLRLSVTAAGYAPKSLGYKTGGSNTLIEVQAELAKAATLSGRLFDTAAQPVAGVKMSAVNMLGMDGRGYPLPDRTEAITDQEGRFEFGNLPEGFTQVWITDSRFHHSGINDLYPVGGRNPEPIEIRASRTGNIRVSVFDKNGKPLTQFDRGKVLIEIAGKEGPRIGSWGGSAEVDKNGSYEFAGVPPGEYRITSHPNPGSTSKEYAPPQSVSVQPGKTIEVKILYY